MRLGVVLAALALAGCGGTDEQAATTAQLPQQPKPDPAPLFYPVARGSVPGWLERIKPLKGLGRWHNAMLSPDGETLLAQWTAECEIPVAFFVPVEMRKPRPVAPTRYETVAVGWNATDGRASSSTAARAAAGPNGPASTSSRSTASASSSPTTSTRSSAGGRREARKLRRPRR
ncbi:MAG TPA: hypothetical protein VFP31_10885 [Gaiellaceae bacterium]|nr:hypothetical protein [Gaiellaceae bacterium]